jgi:hypothetical protein
MPKLPDAVTARSSAKINANRLGVVLVPKSRIPIPRSSPVLLKAAANARTPKIKTTESLA